MADILAAPPDDMDARRTTRTCQHHGPVGGTWPTGVYRTGGCIPVWGLDDVVGDGAGVDADVDAGEDGGGFPVVDTAEDGGAFGDAPPEPLPAPPAIRSPLAEIGDDDSVVPAETPETLPAPVPPAGVPVPAFAPF